ncbi:MAG: hypothetical protein O2923_03375 [Verrucomicrobia bacterium]|nr:hypothetical protein [Verrucomicrobiota bacterium]MDA1086891.1 hypothetical protein [Verrucomicrobiota bacterium]
MRNMQITDNTVAGNREGSAFISVMFVTFMLIAIGFVMTYVTNSASYRVRKDKLAVQSLALAESGVADMVAALGTNYYYWKTRSKTGYIVVGGNTGTYNVTCTTASNLNVVVDSTGTMRGESRTTTLELLGTAQERNNRRWGTNFVILADEYVKLSASAMRIYADVHSNEDMLEGPGNPIVYGNLSAVGTIAVNVQPGYAGTPGAAAREIPEFDFEAYRQAAIDGGIYFPASVSLPGTTLSPPNGIVYCNGDITVNNSSGVNGCIVANGNITINNRFVQTQIVPGMPALLATGHVDLNNRNNYQGVIYARLSVESDNNKDLYGGIISDGWIDIKNRMQVYRETTNVLWSPRDVGDPEIIVGGWLR